MKLGSIKYLTGEGVKSAWVNRLMSLASIGVLVACMVIIGLAILISENVNVAVGKLEQQNVVMVYMKDYSWALYNKQEAETEDTTSKETDSETEKKETDENGIGEDDYLIHNDEEANALCDKIEKLENVSEVEFVSSEEGLKTIKESMLEGQEEYFTFLDEEYGNPLPNAAKVHMKDMAKFDETIKQIKKMDEVSSIQSQDDLAETIAAIKDGIGVAGIWIISILMIIALVIVSNTIRVTMYNRKLDISIMKAVGATDAFVRIPFVVEGVIIGLISAVIAEVLLYFCYRIATETIISALGTSDIVKYGDMAWILLLVFIGIGIIAGVLGSVIIITKYLKHEGSEFSAF
ncbi:MAG: ABC transporter permease [Clostridia bacterium]|nr:ABC transporter permease [Clostridia bacterium]